MATKMRGDQLDVGTGANQVVQLNGSSQLPAVDGSLLTGISGGGDVVVDIYDNVIGVTGAGASVTATVVDNIFLGESSGNAMSGGKENVFLGFQTGQYSVNGQYAVLIGKQAGRNMGDTFHNIAIGNQAMSGSVVTGGYNTVVGAITLGSLTSGAYNSVFGAEAGDKISTGSNNICIGHYAGPTVGAAATSNKLYIDTSETDTPLIGGDFSTNTVTITGTAGIGTVAPTDGILHVSNGTAGAVAANTGYDEIVVEGSGTTGMSILSPDASTGGLMFGSPAADLNAGVYYQKSIGILNVKSFTTTDTIVMSPSLVVSDTGSSISGTAIASIQQLSSTGALPVFGIRQIDQDEPFTLFTGYGAAASLTHSIVAEAEVTTATRNGFVKIQINDLGNQVTDGDYYMAIYTLA